MSVNKLSFPGAPQIANTIPVQLAAGSLFIIPPGQFHVAMGKYTRLQFFDANANLWRHVPKDLSTTAFIYSDGANYRLANLSGCPVGAVITNAGSGQTNGFGTVTITPSAGGSVWRSIVGGAVNTT